MSGRILKSLVLCLVLGGVFAASAAAVPVTEPSIYSVSSSSPSHVIVSEKTVGLTPASVLPKIYSDHGVLLPGQDTPAVVATSGGDGFDWSNAGVASALTLSALLLLGAGALVIRRQHRPLAH
jgi:hypothetical protein